MSKRALQSLTFSTAVAVAKRGITCNLIAPGAVATKFIAKLRERPGFDEANAKTTPMGRMGTAEEIASAVLWLASSGAGFVTGHALVLDGGVSAR
jgi:NAD(P)-dependent dehydrogenase (short-subunit alcohol dehydrogenase family)